jgi:hypothetical protein
MMSFSGSYHLCAPLTRGGTTRRISSVKQVSTHSNTAKGHNFHLFTILAILTSNLVRKPELLFEPRFYAEEGQSFFAFAYNHTFTDYLFSTMYGYYALYNVITTSLASVFPLEFAPFITTWSALAVQLFVSVYPLFADIPILDSAWKRGVVALTFPLLCPSQTWLTTIGVQFWLCILTALIMIEKPSSSCTPRHMANAALLVLAGMTGVLSCMMTPLFLAKAIMTKARQFFLYSVILFAASVVQIRIFTHAFLHHDPTLSHRFVSHSEPLMLRIYSQTILFFSKFFVTEHTVDLLIVSRIDSILTKIINNAFNRDFFAEVETTFFLLTVFMIVILLCLIIKFKNKIDHMLLLISITIMLPLSIILSVNGSGGHRYRFAPMSILILFIISCIDTKVIEKVDRIFLSLLIYCILLCQIADFLPSMHQVYDKSWPGWKAEVAHWRSDNTYPIKIWPPPWELVLKRPD